MIYLHNSYNGPSARLKEWTRLVKSSWPINSVAQSLRYTAAVSPTRSEIVLSLSDAEIERFKRAGDNTADKGVLNTFVDFYGKSLYTHLPGYAEQLSGVVAALIDKGAPMRLDTIVAGASRHADIFGVAAIRWLISNRNKRSLYNDIVLGAVWARENYTVYTPTPLCVGNGYFPDIDYDYPNYTDSSVGFGQRHHKLWRNSVNWHKQRSAAHEEAYYYLGRFPWWLQALLMAADVHRASSIYPWLSRPGAVPKDPTAVQAFYPYYLFGQPALWNVKLRKMKDKHYISSAANWLRKVMDDDDLDFSQILMEGVPSDMKKNFLFGTVEDPTKWIHLVAGCSNRANPEDWVSEYKIVADRSVHPLLRELAYSPDLLPTDALKSMSAVDYRVAIRAQIIINPKTK